MHGRSPKKTPTFALLLACVWAAGPGVAAAADAQPLGWHGETMPEGLTRAEKEGEYLWARDGSVMVYVPPGPFPMGSDDGQRDERPIHQVHLSGYYIDKHEVTWGRWKKSGLPMSDDVESRLPLPRPPDWGIVDDQPAVNVSWRDAVAYAEWAGKRLPTEAEWEKAARGTDGRTYPWGDDEPSFERAVYKGHPIALVSTAPADCCAAGASPYGVLNLAGNVYEWCADVYDRDYYARSPARDPLNDAVEGRRVLRGGAFVLELEELRSSARYRLFEIDRTPYIGFRTALSGVAEPQESRD